MCHALLSLALPLVLAASPSPSSSLAPTGVVFAKAGQIVRVDGAAGRQVLATCEVRERYKLLVEPFEERSETLPCFFTSLATHEPSGRWAVGVMVSERQSNRTADYFVNGKPVPVPPKAGGDFFVLGDADGVTGTSTGSKTAWSIGGKMAGQFAGSFSADGMLLFFSAGTAAESEDAKPVRWRMAFDGPGQPVKAPPSESDLARARLAGVRGDVVVHGDRVFFYRKGKTVLRKMTDSVSLPECDPAAPGTWRRLDRSTGQDLEILKDGWCTTGTAPFVGQRLAEGIVVLNQLGQDRVRRLYRYDQATGTTAPIPVEGLVKTPMAVSADGAFVLALTYQDGLAMYETTTGALVWKAGALPTGKDGNALEAAFVRDGTKLLAHPDRAFLGDGRAIPAGAGDLSLTASQKLKSFFERRQYGTAHVVWAGVHLAELSSMESKDVAARIRSDVQGDGTGWSLLAAWPTSLEGGAGATVIPITEGFSAGTCSPFSTNVRGGRLAFVDWRDGRPEVVACATAGTLQVRRNESGGIELGLDVTFSDGSWAKDFRVWLAPVR
ncbi:MAG: hypothetical protein QM765_30125 [Myxococcales bacterium]